MVGDFLGVDFGTAVWTLDFNRTIMPLLHGHGRIRDSRETLRTGAMSTGEENNRIINCVNAYRTFEIFVILYANHNILGKRFCVRH